MSTGASDLSVGASSLADGASQVSAGASAVKDGMQTMKDTILDAEAELAGKLLPYAQNELADALRIYEAARDGAQSSGYDLHPDTMKEVTVYIIRTDFR